jgi:hypothetical protein
LVPNERPPKSGVVVTERAMPRSRKKSTSFAVTVLVRIVLPSSRSGMNCRMK